MALLDAEAIFRARRGPEQSDRCPRQIPGQECGVEPRNLEIGKRSVPERLPGGDFFAKLTESLFGQ